MISTETCAQRDSADPLAAKREAYDLPADVIYLDGNSLGPPSRNIAERLDRVVREEWGKGLIRSWNQADWINSGIRAGRRMAPLIGAEPHEVVVGDTTSVNLFKLMAAAVKLRPGRKVIVSEEGNFPTDLYMAQGLIEFLDEAHELRLIKPGEDIAAAITEDVALVFLTQVDFKTGRILDMPGLTAAAHEAGALMLWDLCHSAGALAVDLGAAEADFAVGCTYKYLNGGPGSPAFLYVAERLQNETSQPLSGWMGHAAPFKFSNSYEPAPGINRYLSGTHPVLALAALDAALDVWDGVSMGDLREKSVALGDLFIDLMEERCPGHGFELISPRDGAMRGSQVSFVHENGYAIMQALIAEGVIGDYREPGVLRFGFAPLYVGYLDIWNAIDTLARIMDEGLWQAPEYAVRGAVT